MSLESLLLLVFFLALPLLDRLARALRARLIAAAEEAESAARPGPPPLPAADVPPSRRRAQVPRERPKRPAVPETVEPPLRRATRSARFRWQSPIGDRRRAVVLMTILGPCRALEHDAGRQR